MKKQIVPQYLVLLSVYLKFTFLDAAFHRPCCEKKMFSGQAKYCSENNKSRQYSLDSSSKFKNVDDMLDAYQMEPILIYFSQKNCGPCRLQKKELSTVQKIMGDKAFKILAIDTEKWPQVGSRFRIGKLPCLLVLRNKEVVTKLEGLTRAEDLVRYFHSSAPLRNDLSSSDTEFHP
jgi:thioredoxin 1